MDLLNCEERVLQDIYFDVLDQLKDTYPNTPEWDLLWNIVSSYKSYFQKKAENE